MKRHAIVLLLAAAVPAVVTSCSDDKKTSADYCTLVKAFEADSNELDSVFNSDNPDPKQVKAAFDDLKGKIDTLEKSAPSEIAGDVKTVAAASRSMIAALEKDDYDFAKASTDPEFQTVMSNLSSDAVQAAQQNLDEYGSTKCGIATDET